MEIHNSGLLPAGFLKEIIFDRLHLDGLNTDNLIVKEMKMFRVKGKPNNLTIREYKDWNKNKDG